MLKILFRCIFFQTFRDTKATILSSNPLTQPYCCFATNLYRAREKLISRCQLSVILEADVVMLLLLISELADRGNQLAVLLTTLRGELSDLVVVVLSDGRLDSDSARHGALLPQQSSACTQSKPSNIPER